MPLYEIAFIIAIVLFGALALMQERMRQQVHQARFGNQEISSWSLHFSHNLLGLPGIWKLHQRAYERSNLRSSYLAVFITLLVTIILGVCDLLYVRYGQ